MSNSPNCEICRPTDDETKLIQEALFSQLQSLKQKMKTLDESNDEIGEESGGFNRILKIIFNRKYKNFKQTTVCKHHHLKKEFMNLLKCNMRLLDVLSDRISSNTAKYNYHIDVISQQVKTFPRHFFHQSNSTPPKIEKIEEKESTEKKTEKLNPQIPCQVKKIQNCLGTEVKREPTYLQNATPVNSFINTVVPFTQNFSPLFNPVNFTWGFPIPNFENQQKNENDQE